MKTKKNIDRLYHDRLKDVETIPREEVWKNIAARLPQKEKKKRSIPLWFKLAGTAAVLALLFGVGSTLLPSGNEPSFGPTTSFSSASEGLKDKLKNSNQISTDFREHMDQGTLLLRSLMEQTQTQLSSLSNHQQNTHGKTKSPARGNTNLFADIIISTPDLQIGTSGYTFEDYNTAAFDEETKNSAQESAPAAQKELKDLTLVASEENKDPEEENNELSLTSKRISVSTTAGAVYFDNLGTGNSIGREFGNNKTSGKVSVAYGVNIAYQVSEKVKIRSGVNKVDFSQNTEGVEYTAAVSAITRGSGQLSFAAPLSPNISGEMDDATTPFVTNRISGELSQHMGFIEVPLEIEYALIDKQVGLHLIGGASTLFLNNNMVTMHSPDAASNLGEAENLNNVSFSTNIGVGIDYNISPSLQWNLEPIFKYQLNTFDDAPGVKPYNLGIYSGFSFKF